MTRVVKCGSKEITVEIKRTKRRRTVALQVVLPSKVIVSSPAFLKEVEIDRIIEKQMAWVVRRLRDLEEVSGFTRCEKEFVSGESFPYLGRQYRLKIVKADKNGHNKCSLVNGRLRVKVNEGFDGEANQNAAKKALIEWYCRRAYEKIPDRIRRHAKLIGRQPKQVLIKAQKKRWGSCSPQGNINLNWKIIMVPISVLDYIIVHELCHLVHPGHSRQFWELVESVIPDHKKRRSWLKQNSSIVGMFD